MCPHKYVSHNNKTLKILIFKVSFGYLGFATCFLKASEFTHVIYQDKDLIFC